MYYIKLYNFFGLWKKASLLFSFKRTRLFSLGVHLDKIHRLPFQAKLFFVCIWRLLKLDMVLAFQVFFLTSITSVRRIHVIFNDMFFTKLVSVAGTGNLTV